MAVRKRFSKEERALLASGAPLEVQNVTQWHAATLAPGAVITRDGYGWERIAAVIDSTRGTVRAGDPWPVAPGHVRARAPQVIDNTRGQGFEHACAGSWHHAGSNAAGHDVFACDSGRHLVVDVHRDAAHVHGAGCADIKVTVQA